MKKTNAMYVDRTKLLDMAIANIQLRMNMFKKDTEKLLADDFETDHNLAGNTWKRLPDEDNDLVFHVGKYAVENKIATKGSAEFQVHFDYLTNRIKGIYILLDNE